VGGGRWEVGGGRWEVGAEGGAACLELRDNNLCELRCGGTARELVDEIEGAAGGGVQQHLMRGEEVVRRWRWR
jgi:hypothetical protein